MGEVVRVYHGSRHGLVGKIRPDATIGSNDFGAGFYMGTEPSQPTTLICREEDPVLYTIDFDLTGLRVHRFEVDIEWALFVAFNRGKLNQYVNEPFYLRFERLRVEHDVFFGKIANDKMFTAMSAFFEKLIGSTALVASLKALNIGDQYCAATERACAQIVIRDEKRFSRAELNRCRERYSEQRKFAETTVSRVLREHRREGIFMDEMLEKGVTNA